MKSAAVIVFLSILSNNLDCFLAQDEPKTSTAPSDDRQFRPDSLSCNRFHAAISRKENDCVTSHLLFIKMHCNFSCRNEKLRLQNCHRHADKDYEYPDCDDIFCRNADDVVTCNELQIQKHKPQNNISPNPAWIFH